MKLRMILWPFAVLYDLIMRVRNHLYNIGHKSSFRFEVPVIAVGNLKVGGSGKTPMIEYLIRLLGTRTELATLSRGYGRTTRGLRFATKGDSFLTIGDEPFQLFRKFSDVHVVVAADRVFAIPHILHEFPGTGAILLDDAFQHRSVNPHFSVLLTEYDDLFVDDWVLPAGNLREARQGARRADVIVVTKSPASAQSSDQITKRIRMVAGDKPIFFSSIDYGEPVRFGNSDQVPASVVMLTGVANPGSLAKYAWTKWEVRKHFRFRDHHKFTRAELEQVVSLARETKSAIITTEKDMTRIIDPVFDDLVSHNAWFYLPIEITMRESGSEFDRLVLQAIRIDKS